MASEINLVGSRIPMMHIGYDCPTCARNLTVTLVDGGVDAAGGRRVVQQPLECPDCGARIEISLVAEAVGSRTDPAEGVKAP